jgi:hypothetical protein
MRRQLSRAIRVYAHAANGELIRRDNFNFYQGMNEVEHVMRTPGAKVVAVGSEEGAMALHYRLC